jgi:hypothetical protein
MWFFFLSIEFILLGAAVRYHTYTKKTKYVIFLSLCTIRVGNIQQKPIIKWINSYQIENLAKKLISMEFQYKNKRPEQKTNPFFLLHHQKRWFLLSTKTFLQIVYFWLKIKILIWVFLCKFDGWQLKKSILFCFYCVFW